MKARIQYKNREVEIDLSRPLDISIPLHGGEDALTAWYLPPPEIIPHRIGSIPGAVSQGASVNFNDIRFNPHAHGTHTECVGHITPEVHSVNQQLTRYFYLAHLISIEPEPRGGDRVISRPQLEKALGDRDCEALVIRTLPNEDGKCRRQYAHTNPPYLEKAAAKYLADRPIDHLLIDVPSVDREKDEGRLAAHKAFWNYQGPMRLHATITELIFVPDSIADGAYLLELQVAPFENDASPSRPILYKIEEE